MNASAAFVCAALAAAAPPAAASDAEPLKNLTVALYHGASTRDSSRFLMEYYRDEAPYQVRPDIDNASRFLVESGAAVTRPFGSAKNVERIEDAARAGADLVAILEAGADFKRDIMLEKRARVTLRVEFRDLAGKRIAQCESESVQAPMVDARVRVRRDLYREFAAALDEAAAQLEEQVRSAPGLTLFAAARPAGAVVESAPQRAFSSEVDRAAYRNPVEASAMAWVVGVERYQDGTQAPHAERDAAAVRNQLIGLGWPDRNVLWLTGRRADLAQMSAALAAFKSRGTGAAKAFVYFSGRALTDSKTGRSALLGWDGAGLPLDDVLAAASSLGASVAVMEAPVVLGGPRPGLAAMAASGPAEPRQVQEQEGHGLFTLEFLSALTGAADKRGKVSARTAFDRAAVRVRAASAGKQNPSWSAAEGTDPTLIEGARQ